MAASRRDIALMLVYRILASGILCFMHLCETNMANQDTVPLNNVKVRLHKNACLVCPVTYDYNSGLAWKKSDTNTYLFRDNARIYHDQNLQLTINKCSLDSYSLGVINVTIDLNDGMYTCWKSGSLRAYFKVSVAVKPTVTIVLLNDVSHEDRRLQAAVTEGSDVEIQCIISSAIQPFNVTWSRNGKLYKSEQFIGPEREAGNFTAHLRFNMEDENENITCQVDGYYTNSEQNSVLLTRETNLVTTKETKASGKEDVDVTYVMVPVLFGLSTLMSVLMYLKVKHIRSNRQGSDEATHPVAYTTTLNRSVEGEVQYESPQEMIGDMYFYGDNNVLNRNDFVLVSFIPCTGRRKRWIASPKWKGKSSVVATTLCAKIAKTEDWLDMRLLAEHLRHIPKHENVVAISGCDTDQIPYYIYSEHVTNGTLLDILCKAKYDELYSKTIYMQGLRGTTESTDVYRIGSFLLEPLKAIFFLESIDCDHIALCARKVLMTPNMTCKLYDFNLRSSTKKIVAKENLEEWLRLPWLAPETIFDRNYDRGSDVRSFAVFIWEVFSEGDVPFDGVDIKKFSSSPKDIPLLAQPRLCSDAVYAIMKSCLMVNPSERIGLTALKTKLFNMVEGVDQ